MTSWTWCAILPAQPDNTGQALRCPRRRGRSNNLISRTDANNHQTTYGYDDANRITSVTNPLNKTWSVSYDAASNRTGITKPSGGTVTITYDALNRPTGVAFSDSTPSISYAYDANSNRTQLTDGAGTQTYTYNALNRVTDISRGTDSFTYDYDANGNVTTRTYPGGTSITSTYTDDNHVASVTRSGNTANYSYDAAGNPTQITLPNNYVESRTYDAAGRITQVKHSTGASVLAQFDYSYDAADDPTSVTTPNSVTTYGYDSRERLTSVCFQTSCPGGSDPFIRWTYDAVGNRVSEARPSGTTTYTYDAADELTAVGSTSYTYDANGNETQAGSRTFTWNLAGQLASTTSGGSTTGYTYDGDGNRLQASSTSQTTNYLWDTTGKMAQLAVERDGSGNALRNYTYGLGLLSMSSGGGSYYFHGDALGSIVNVTGSSGQTEWTYSYEPFGATRSQTKNDPVAPDNPIGFAGQLVDADTGLYDFRARVFDSASGRFLSPDPMPGKVTEAASSTYAYAANNPVAYVDPAGLSPARTVLTSVPSISDQLARLYGKIYGLAHGSCAPSPDIMPKNLPGGLLAAWVWGYEQACHHRQALMREQTKQNACAGSGKWPLTAIFAVAAAIPIATGGLSILLGAIPEYAAAGALGGAASLFGASDAFVGGIQGALSITWGAAFGVGAGLCASQ